MVTFKLNIIYSLQEKAIAVPSGEQNNNPMIFNRKKTLRCSDSEMLRKRREASCPKSANYFI